MSFIEDMEAIVEEASDWGAQLVENAIKVLSPNGRPFMYAELDEQEQIIEYLNFRGDPQAWAEKIGDTAGEIMMKLQQSAVPPDEIKAIHPIDLAIKFTIEYSYNMEKLIRRKANGLLSSS